VIEDRLLRDIQAQPANLERVLAYQTGEGAADLNAAAEIIRESKHVVLTGMGSSLFASIPAELVFRRRGIPARAVEAGELLHYGRDLLRHSCVVMTSRSGESIEIERLLEAGAAMIVGVTNVPDSTLARRADKTIFVDSMSDEMVAIQTYTGTLATLLLLAGESADALAPIAGSMADWICSWNLRVPQLIDGAPVFYFLGRGPSRASCFAGMLAMHEIAKQSAVALDAATFRHGVLEVVDAGFRSFVFAPAGPSRELSVGLAREIRQHGGQATLVETNTPDDAAAPLLEVVPAQLTGYYLAKAKSIVPGQFRYVSQVTRTE
jgi:glutamine---fructose-6-phosphate transaminase (isomerizing)